MLNTPHETPKSSINIFSKKLIDAYTLYIAITERYKLSWKAIEQLLADSKKLQPIIHTMVLSEQNQPHNHAMSFTYKENQSYQELPYLYCKKNLSTTRKKISWYLTSLHTQNNVEQSAICHCLTHTLTKIELLESTVVITPEYYTEQIKIASVKQPIILELLKGSISSIAKKLIPFF